MAFLKWQSRRRTLTFQMKKGTHQIGEVAEATGLSIRTIRYYEEMNLITPSERSQGGFRLYIDADIKQLLFIKNLKPLELSIDEMRELILLRHQLKNSSIDNQKSNSLDDRLQEFIKIADERCRRLESQLEAGKKISRTLRSELAASKKQQK